MKANSTAQSSSKRASLLATLPQTQPGCRLFDLPAELRTYTYELILSVQQNEKGQVRLTFHPTSSSTTKRPSVLSVIATCRLIYTEAAAIFYNINDPLHLPHGSLRSRSSPCYVFNRCRGFLHLTSSERLSGIQRLSTTVWTAEEATIVCKAVARFLPKLRCLSIAVSSDSHWSLMQGFKIEPPLLKRAVAKLTGLESLGFEWDLGGIDDERSAKLREIVDGVVAILPKNAGSGVGGQGN